MTMRAAGALMCAAVVAGCGSNEANPTVDIGRIAEIKASFGPQFQVTEVAPTGIDPRVLAGQKLPDGMRFDPPACAQFATGQLVPPGTEGNMAAVSAEGAGNRFVVIALETNEAVPVVEPGPDCRRVAFVGRSARGTVEVSEVPTIEGTRTIGVHRVVQAVVEGQARTGEVYNFSAHFGNYQVIVSANPLVLPGSPVASVDVRRARDLLIAGVNAVRG